MSTVTHNSLGRGMLLNRNACAVHSSVAPQADFTASPPASLKRGRSPLRRTPRMWSASKQTKQRQSTLHAPLLPSAPTLAFVILHAPVQAENGVVCHSYTSTTGGEAELDGLLDALALQLADGDADAVGVVLLPNDGESVPVLLRDRDPLTLRDGDHDTLGDADVLADKLTLSLGLGVLDGLEVPVMDAVAEEEAVLESDTAGDSDVESDAEVDCVDDAVKDSELDDVTVAVLVEAVLDTEVLSVALAESLDDASSDGDRLGDGMNPEAEGVSVADSIGDARTATRTRKTSSV